MRSLPLGWESKGLKRWGDHENTLILKQPGSKRELKLHVKILASPETLSSEELDKKLLREVDFKVGQRREEGLADYHPRENSYERHTVGGHPALSWVAEFTYEGKNMVEYLTRIHAHKSNALFFIFLPAGELDDLKTHVNPIIETLRLP